MKRMKNISCVLFSLVLAISMCPLVPASATIVNGSASASSSSTAAGSTADTQTAIDGAPTDTPADTSQAGAPDQGAPVPGQGDGGTLSTAAETPSWQKLQDAIRDAADGATIALESDYTASAEDAALVIPAGKNVTIDLSGHTLDRGLSSTSENGHVIQVDGKLTIVDVSASAGAITGGNAQQGGGVVVNAGGTLTFASGSIQGNAAQSGGGVYVSSGATLNLFGGSIKGNSASASGGGVLVASGASAVSVQGSPVVQGNSASDSGADVQLPDGFTLEVSGPLSAGAKVGVTLESGTGVFTNGYAKNNGGADPSTYFSAPDGMSVSSSEGEARLVSAESGSLTVQGSLGGGLSTQDANVTVTTWADLQSAIDGVQGGETKTIRLDGGINAGDGDATLKITDGRQVTIDLAGNKIDRCLADSGPDDNNNGHVFDVNQGTLTIKDSVRGGTITGGYTKGWYGGGIIIGGNGHLIVEGGSISGNKSTDMGGGIFVYGGGQLTMTGGSVTGNWSGDGGGIYVDKGGTINLNGVSITDNSTDAGGGAINNKGTATLTNCTLGNNTAKMSGGGIWNGGEGTLTLDSCTFTGNKTDIDGGALCSYGTATLTNCIMQENVAEKSGGALRVHGGTVTMSGCTMGGQGKGNIAKEYGGGIYINNGGTITLQGTAITHNTAYTGGGGAFVASETNGFNVGSGVVVSDNLANNIYLTTGKKIAVTEALGSGTNIGVSLDSLGGTFTTGFQSTNGDADPSQFFTAEAGYSIMKDTDGEAKVVTSDWVELQELVEKTQDGQTLTLEKSYKAVDDNTALVIPEGKSITLDLAGYTIDRHRSSYTADGEVIIVNGTLSIVDNSSDKTGVITGGYGDAGGIRVNGTGKLTLQSGTISDNKSRAGGGGIRVLGGGTLATYGGTISKNTSEGDGGGIYICNSGTAALAGETTISNNTAANGTYTDENGEDVDADGKGGGIYTAGTATLESGSIASNTAQRGGGVYAASGATFTMNGGSVSSNTAKGGGGGLCIDGTVNIATGEIAGNNAEGEGGGGGIKLAQTGTLKLYGGSVTDNHAAYDGGGVYNAKGTFNVKGAPKVTNNAACTGKNILLDSDSRITLDGKLTYTEAEGGEKAQLDVVTRESTQALTSGFAANGNINCFTTNDVDNKMLETHDDGELYMRQAKADVWVSNWNELKYAVVNSSEGQVIGLSNDILDADGRPSTPFGKKVTIELNGHALGYGAGNSGPIFEVRDGSDITFRDSIGTGAIRRGYSDAPGGGAIYITGNSQISIFNVAIIDCYARDSGGAINIHDGRLYMEGATIARCGSANSGGAIYCGKDGRLTLKQANISSNNCVEHSGGALDLRSHGDVTIEGCTIRGNYSQKEDGGGIYMDLGSDQHLKIERTHIVDNSCSGDHRGGGIFVNNGILDMNGGSIGQNQAPDGGGIYINDCAVNLNSVRLWENKAIGVEDDEDHGDGGAIYNRDGRANLVYCDVGFNEAKRQGGAILGNEDSIVYAENCIFDGNKAGGNGGALAVYGENTVKGGTFKGNESEEYGGAIHVGHNDCKFSLDGSEKPVTITGNTANYGGSGVRVSHLADGFWMKGAVTIRNNSDNNDLYLENDIRVSVTGELTGSSIGVVLEKGNGTFTSGFASNNSGHGPQEFFVAPAGFSVIPTADGAEGQIAASDWPTLQQLIDATGQGKTLKLDRSWKAAPENVALQIAAGKEITIDLNGYTIDRARTEYSAGGEVFDVYGNLTIADTSVATETAAAASGKVAGGYGDGGGFIVYGGGALTLAGGYIQGNGAQNGGGVLVNEGSTFTMSGGTITENEVSSDGGGVHSSGTVSLTGGSIANNEARGSGGALWFAAGSTLNVSGTPNVAGNIASIGKNVLIPNGGVIKVTGALDSNAKLDVVTPNASAALTSGLTTSGLTEEKVLGVFTYDNAAGRLEVRDGDGELHLKQTAADITVSGWQELQKAMNTCESGKVIRLANDITAGGDERTLAFVRPGETLTIDLAGYKIDRNLLNSDPDEDNGGHVFDVNKGTLTITDSAGTGRISGGNDDGRGGGIVIGGEGTLELQGGSVVDNRCSEEGGGIFVYGTLTMTGGYIGRNTAESGAGIFVHEAGNMNLSNVVLIGNNATEWGGGAINNKGEATLTGCTIRENSAGNEGGGIYQGSKTLTLDNCAITDNSAPGGGGTCCFGTVTATNTNFAGNQASDQGGGINVHGTLTVSGGSISGNYGGDGGGIYNSGGTVTINDATIGGNTTGAGGGGMNNKGTATLTNCTISGNSGGGEGGGIYANSSGYTELHGCTIKDNKTTGNDGGAFCTYGSAKVDNCSITGNYAEKSGGALRIHNGTVDLTGGTFMQNTAKEYGGAIYINDSATLNIDAAAITQNTANITAGGIYVGDDVNGVNIKGAVTVAENNGGCDVYLPSGKVLNVAGSLGAENGEHAKVGVSTDGAIGVVFTSGYAGANPNVNPSVYFFSNDDYEVYQDGNEASTKLPEKETDPFIDPGIRVNPDYGELSGKNWMSGISGERRLHEINMPGTHDSSMKVAEGNVSTGKISLWAGLIGTALGFIVLPIGPVGGGLLLPEIVAEYAKQFALTQTRYIDEQLEDGIRSIDIRLNTYYCNDGYPVKKHDDGENLYQLHGKTDSGGSFFAKDHDDNFLTFKTTCAWLRDFLEKHPSETVIVNVAYESVDNDAHDDYLARLSKHLRNELANQINPSTGKPYLYMEDGVFAKKYTQYPKLKDCRGQVILQCGEEDVETLGGLVKGVGLDHVEGPEGSYKDDADAKIIHLKRFFAGHGFDSLPAGVNSAIDYLISVGTNGTSTGFLGIPEESPLEIADQVLPVLFASPGGLLLDRVGKYIGLINMDGETAEYSKLVWITNFFGGLENCTVTVKASDDDQNPKTYSVPCGATFDIPECIYDNPRADGKYFQYWQGATESNTWTSEPGSKCTVVSDTTFTAVWDNTPRTPIVVLWRDGENAENTRPDTLPVTVTVGSAEQTLTITKENNWNASVKGDVASTDYIVPDLSFDTGKRYTCKVEKRDGKPGYLVELTYTPNTTVNVTGTIRWVDKDNAGNTRPLNVTVHLEADSKTAESAVIEPDADGNWTFDFGKKPEYVDGAKVRYSIAEDDVDGYIHYKKGFDVTNVLSGASTTELSGYVYWTDDNDAAHLRPESVEVRLLKDGKKVSSQVLAEDRLKDAQWPFSFVVDGVVDGAEYTVEQDAVEGYGTKVYSFASVGGMAYIVNTLEAHVHAEQTLTVPMVPATCTDDGSQLVITYCSECGETISSEKSAIPALGHEWGAWRTLKEPTETQMGYMVRTCTHNEQHEQYRVLPTTDHKHGLTHVEAKAATCTEDGNTEYWVCTESAEGSEPCHLRFEDAAGTKWVHEEATVVHATGHSWGEWQTVTEATEVSWGVEKRVCNNDGAHMQFRIVPMKDHAHGLVHVEAKAATCTDDGNIEYWKCEEGENPCGLCFTDEAATQWVHEEGTVVHATGHDWGAWTTVKRATETEMGLEKRTCTRCGKAQTRVIPMVGHVHKLVKVDAKAPTCTDDGNIEYWKCSEGDHPCGLCFKDPAGGEWVHEEGTVVHALGHEWAEATYEWNADNTEVTATHVCLRDATHSESETVEAITVPLVPPTCTEAGKSLIMTKLFEGSGFMPQSKQGEIPALGHDWGEWVVVTPATETSEGLEQRTCVRCGEVETRAIPATIAYRYVGAEGQTWTKGSGEALSFTFKRSLADETTFDHFTGIAVDGVEVPESNDSGVANYTAKSGSVVVALQPAYLETLSAGSHEIVANFDDGSASTQFAVTAVSPDNSGDDAKQKTSGTASGKKAAKTGDSAPIAPLAGAAMFAILILAVAFALRRRPE